MHRNLNILVVDPAAPVAREISDALEHDAWGTVTLLSSLASLEQTLALQDPDAILIHLSNPDCDMLKQIGKMSGARQRPVAVFVEQTDAARTQAAISAGLSAYVVNGMQADRVKSVLETAIIRFSVIDKMQTELDAAKQALIDRKTIDRAKGVLISARQVSEQEAYNLLRKTAMDQGRKVIDVATAIVSTADLLQ